jgi:hypothetical protein
MSKEEKHNIASCMLSILDSLKLYDNNSLELGDETLSEMMFRKMKGYNIDLNKELGFTHLKPVTKTKKMKEIDLGEYLITINHQENGLLEVEVFDELGEQVEGIYISNSEEE